MTRHLHPSFSSTTSNFTNGLPSPSESIGLVEEHEEKYTSSLISDENFSSDSFSIRGLNQLPSSWLPSSWLQSPRLSSHLFAFLTRIVLTLVPSFLTNRQSSQKSLSPTAYLDGLRGLAALFVFFCHYSYTCFVITDGFGYHDPKTDSRNLNLLQLPIIRLLYSGPPMVCVFFVISGYALSLKPLKQIRSRSYDDLLTTMSSSIFRRGLRLFLPTTASTFLVFVMLRLGMYEPSREIAGDSALHRNVHEMHPPRMDGFFHQLTNWLHEMLEFVAVFNWKAFAGSTGYDVHLWTIPVEFRCSLMLFLAVVGLARLRSIWRLAMLFGIWCFSFGKDRWELVLFFSGMAIAELDLIIAQHGSLSENIRSLRPYRSIGWITLAIVSLFLMSQPDSHFESTPGFIWLSTFIPAWFSESYRFYQTLGSITFVLAVARHSSLQSLFNYPVVQYLGKISYALYLMHGPVMHSIGYVVQAFVWRHLTGYESENAYIGGFIVGAMINIPLVIWAADVFWRVVDGPSVRFARWLEGNVIVREGDGLLGVSRGRLP
jgi:peptidoglycan/LPS O-acetylase OafA/YrhL